MKPARLSGLGPILTAFLIWFAHFMICWAAVEIWPQQRQANLLAWVLTAIALLALGVHWARLNASAPGNELTGFTRRLGRGATAIATVAVGFSAVPSLVFVP